MSLSYEVTNWENGKTVLKAEHLRKIEKGITDIISENDAIYKDEDIRKSNEKQRQEEHSRKMNEVSEVVSDIQKDYDSLQKIIIDENASANLQNQINQTNSQLEHKPNKTHIWNMANMGQDVKEAMTGGSVAVVGENTILTENIVDGQVTPSKTDFISLIAPTFEKNKCVSGHIIEDGTIASSGWTTTDFIPICKGHIYKIQGKTKFIALYDSSKNIIEGSYGTVTIPNRQFYSGYDGYVRFSFVTLDSHPDYQPLDTLEIYSTLGNYLTLNAPLVPNFLEKSIQDKDLATGCINARHFGVTNSIHRLKDLATMDGYIIYTNGNLFANSNYCYTEEPIPILEGSTYFIKHAVPNAGVYYDEDMNFLSLCDLPVSGAVDNVIFTTPVGAKYLRLNTQIINKETQYIALGTRELTQEEFDNVSLSSVSATWLKADIDDTVRNEFKQEILDEINLNQPSNYSSDWLGKTFVSLGDSITWQDSNAYGQGEQKGQIARGYQTIIKEKLGFISYLNKGMSGRPVSNGSANGDGTNTTSKTIDYSNFDLVIIAGGTNDFKLNMPLGELGIIGDTDFNTNTFYGAYRDMVEYILKQKPTIRIVLFTPLQRDNGGYDVNYVNSIGCKLIDYVNAIKDVGKMYGIPICDMYSNSGFTKLTLNTYTMDGLHPNDVGYSRMGNYASKFIDNIGI